MTNTINIIQQNMGSEIVCVFIETAGNFCPSAGAKTSEVQKGRCKRRQTMKLYLPKAAEKEKPRSRERERDEREREREGGIAAKDHLRSVWRVDRSAHGNCESRRLFGRRRASALHAMFLPIA